LERALKQSARNGGHNVQGHVDGVGEISHIEADGQGALLVTIQVPVSLARYIVDKGFITIDGMSITVIKAETDFFTVTFIPYTQQATVVKHYRVGSKVNIEVDILAKYVEKLIRSQMNVREC
jgi:riboflavin synthase